VKANHEISVLIIDEHPGISPLLAERLNKLPGIQVIGETANVLLGAELAHQFRPDVILADFRRTGPPPAETYRWLGRISPRSKLAAHVSYLADGESRTLSEAGVDLCIVKGTSVTSLSEQLRNLARSAHRSPRQEVSGHS
jgi:DNA-binding NarL/FixJ family response regulator